MTEATAAKERCKRCNREIDICELCEEPGCKSALCYACRNNELKQSLVHPHAHGG